MSLGNKGTVVVLPGEPGSAPNPAVLARSGPLPGHRSQCHCPGHSRSFPLGSQPGNPGFVPGAVPGAAPGADLAVSPPGVSSGSSAVCSALALSLPGGEEAKAWAPPPEALPALPRIAPGWIRSRGG